MAKHGTDHKGGTTKSAFKTADTLVNAKRKRQINAVNTAPAGAKAKVAKGFIKTNQGKRK